MDIKKGWYSEICSTPDSEHDEIGILLDGKEVAVIKKTGKELIISWRKPEKDYDIPIDWFIELLQKAKKTLA